MNGRRTILELAILITAGSLVALIGLQRFLFAPLATTLTRTSVVLFFAVRIFSSSAFVAASWLSSSRIVILAARILVRASPAPLAIALSIGLSFLMRLLGQSRYQPPETDVLAEGGHHDEDEQGTEGLHGFVLLLAKRKGV